MLYLCTDFVRKYNKNIFDYEKVFYIAIAYISIHELQ